MNKNIKNFMSIIMIGSVLSTGSVYARDFKDITPKGDYKWAYESVNKLQSSKVFGGYEDGTFRPSRPVSFLETMQIIKNIKKPSAAEIKNSRQKFEKTAKKYKVPEWAMNAVCYSLNNNTITETTLKAAFNKGFLNDVNTVYPDRNSVTVYFGRALGFSGQGDLSLLKHKDKNNIAEITKGYLADLIAANIYSATGSDGMFNGKKHIRRVEVAVIADKTLNYLSNHNDVKNYTEKTGDLTAGLSRKVTGKINLITLSGKESLIKINNTDYKVFMNSVKIKDSSGDYKGDILSLKDADVTAEIVNNEVISITINKLPNSASNPETGVSTITDDVNKDKNTQDSLNNKENTLKEENTDKIPADGKIINIVGNVLNSVYTGDQYEIEVNIIASDSKDFPSKSTIKILSNKEYKINQIVKIKGTQLNDETKDLRII